MLSDLAKTVHVYKRKELVKLHSVENSPSSNMLKLATVLAATAVCAVLAENKHYLYTRNNPFAPELITGYDVTAENSNLDFSYDTIMLIHEHEGSPTDTFNTFTKNEILKITAQPYNVLVFNWEPEAKLTYDVAASNVPVVAEKLTKLIKSLTEQIRPLDLNKLHLVGFGLGAHVAGIASRGLHKTHGIPARITGLDPAGKGWGSDSPRLRHDDAEYVEVIHTDSAGLLALGIETPIGQINFYANGGSNQPGCYSHSCNHQRAYELFAASLSHDLVGKPCMSTVQLNLNLCIGYGLKLGGTEYYKRSQSNIYRINTGREFPF